MIAIIDYGMGNLRSVQKAFENSGAEARITQDAEMIGRADKVVLPGVGAIRPAMAKLTELGLVPAIRSVVEKGTPFLGICLGFQLLFEKSFEGGESPALGILPGAVERFTAGKIPHMGWNALSLARPECPLWAGLNDGAYVYFCHSYYVRPRDPAVTSASTDYGITFTSAVWSGNIFGVQFHPEKSQDTGLKIISNFIAYGR
jgi:glutamine amidotransferase